MKPPFLIAVVAIALFLTLQAIADECSFADIHEQYEPTHAKADAHEAAKVSNFKFIGVADGLGPSRPGFEEISLTKCLMFDVEWELLWVGADSVTCENGDFLQQKATKYARIFNTEMLEIVVSTPSFACAADLASAN